MLGSLTSRCRKVLTNASALVSDTQSTQYEELPPSESVSDRSHTTDYVVVGSGIGGLCCAALLAKYGHSVTVCESHYLPGGAAHSFEVNGYKFDAGPSFHAGLSGPPGKSANPLKQVLDAVGETVECATYNRWIVYSPEGTFPCVAEAAQYRDNILKIGGPEALRQWRALETAMVPLQKGAALFPAAAIRGDLGVLLTAARFMGPQLAMTGLVAPQLTGPFAAIVDRHVTHPWLRKFLDLECFVLSGMTAQDTIAAEMAFMFMERNSGKSSIDYPLGGSASIINALLRAITHRPGGRLLLRAHVDSLLLEGGRAVGVQLRPQPGKQGQGGVEVIRARKAVISNASVWDTQKLLPPGVGPQPWRDSCAATPQVDSFVHLHLGIDAAGLPADLDCHHLIVNQWDDITAPQNVCIVSIPTVFDPSLAPPGKAVVHAYVAANEPYALWEGKQRGSEEYRCFKEERSAVLWAALERVIPDIRQRTQVKLVGSPLTHERFLRRHRGSYGPAISARTGTFPGPATPIPGLYCCGDSCMPGIGVPAAAASGMIVANTLSSVWDQLTLLDDLKM